MVNALLKLLAALLSILLLFVFPLLESFQRQDDIATMHVMKSVNQFADTVRDKGLITPEMWNRFVMEIERTGNMFAVDMIHYEKKYDPIYEDPLERNTFKSDFLTHYQLNNKASILKTLFPQHAQPFDASDRRYKLKIGDYFSVTVKNTNRTQATVLLGWLSQSFAPTEKIVVPAGGMVRNEDY
ncbi:hypothetical protein [Paenibacillus apiarius]|uniref:Uncharacterized protein n=1 Tax=Paenibacillus apiarius TaxID=46240 RepID=A0ABT4DU06_9BACL|nr:hypothetical protein [Paenibacillus apiarius]MCY9515930.1 hypothetical protein [Paenibacillus apiarius]MCY9520840.1 hypothetical protein [Paenibacillus apiarius]MCY9553545.1 hypothetical protein [Paenibacillus apiarius]MCY9557932.1 hypothetical protein [Paenibacillus apiarius]MCY9685787.1 hypothetical protein [Paenibacillus apiarius]